MACGPSAGRADLVGLVSARSPLGLRLLPRSRVQVWVGGATIVRWGGWPRNSIRARVTSSSPANTRMVLPVGWSQKTRASAARVTAAMRSSCLLA